MFYCGASHQKIDWKNGHKQKCSIESDGVSRLVLLFIRLSKHCLIFQPKATSTFLFPEFELVLDAEDGVELSNETDEQSELRRMNEYQELIQSGNVNVMPDASDADLMQYAQSVEDVAFGKFKKRIARNNEQVLRYNRGGEPLWISSKNTLEQEQVPPCEQCQSKRVFEFQVSVCCRVYGNRYKLTV